MPPALLETRFGATTRMAAFAEEEPGMRAQSTTRQLPIRLEYRFARRASSSTPERCRRLPMPIMTSEASGGWNVRSSRHRRDWAYIGHTADPRTGDRTAAADARPGSKSLLTSIFHPC